MPTHIGELAVVTKAKDLCAYVMIDYTRNDDPKNPSYR